MGRAAAQSPALTADAVVGRPPAAGSLVLPLFAVKAPMRGAYIRHAISQPPLSHIIPSHLPGLDRGDGGPDPQGNHSVETENTAAILEALGLYYKNCFLFLILLLMTITSPTVATADVRGANRTEESLAGDR